MTRLMSAGCSALDLDVNVAFTAVPETTWTHHAFHIALARVAPAARTGREPSLQLTVEVLHGTASQAAYTFTSLPVTIGRGAEVRDSRHQLLRDQPCRVHRTRWRRQSERLAPPGAH